MHRRLRLIAIVLLTLTTCVSASYGLDQVCRAARQTAASGLTGEQARRQLGERLNQVRLPDELLQLLSQSRREDSYDALLEYAANHGADHWHCLELEEMLTR